MRIQKILTKLLAISLLAPVLASAATFQDPLDVPAKASAQASKGLINGLAMAGNRLVAVGQRGHILLSDDQGKSWQQASVPVSSDLVAVYFPTPQNGWAVGHDGVVLHSADAGKTWVKQLDGRTAGQRMLSYYDELARNGALGSAEESAKLLDEVRRIAQQGAENPFLDVWFADEKVGFVVGAFNLIYRTADGGKTWEPWFHRTANPTRLHLYAIRPSDSGLFVVGEQGLVMKLASSGDGFVALNAGYRGTFFGVAGSGPAVIAFGLRGHAFRSADGGATWTQIETGLQDGITAASRCADGRLVLASQSGRVLMGDQAVEKFQMIKLAQPVPASAALCVNDKEVLIGGVRGIYPQQLK